MAVELFALTQFDRVPPLAIQMTYPDGTPYDLSDATVINFAMCDAYTKALVTYGACTVDDAATGLVSYHWAAGDTAAPGEFLGQFVAQTPNGRMSYPPENFIHVRIAPSLNA